MGPRMMATLSAPRLRIGNFAGLRGTNVLDLIGSSKHDFFFSSIRAVLSIRKGAVRRLGPKVIMLSQEEARCLGHNFAGTEQILLGLIGEGTGIASKVLKSMGISLKDARVEVQKIIGRVVDLLLLESHLLRVPSVSWNFHWKKPVNWATTT